MLPGLNSAAVGLISGAVVLLTFQIHGSSPFPTFSMCIGGRPSASFGHPVLSLSMLCCAPLRLRRSGDSAKPYRLPHPLTAQGAQLSSAFATGNAQVRQLGNTSEGWGLPAGAGMVCFGLVDFCECPSPLAVLLGGILGVIGWAAHAH